MGTGGGEDSYVNVLVKYFMFFFNFVFWLIGTALIGIGGWAYYEKNKFSTPEAESIYDIIFDVSIVMVFIGFIIFSLAFAGCLGALRENICLLKFFSYALAIIFLLEIIGAVLAFVFSSEIEEEITVILQDEALVRYRDDADFQSLIDWFQETFECCGVGIDGYKDWSKNAYFNCTPDNPSWERCAVPYSCCINPNSFDEQFINTQCGYGTQLLSIIEAAEVIYTKGCIPAVRSAVEDNLYIVGGVAIGLAIPQLLGIFLARVLANQIQDQRDRWV